MENQHYRKIEQLSKLELRLIVDKIIIIDAKKLSKMSKEKLIPIAKGISFNKAMILLKD
tara:strand:+ start:262 stop:438 length:177 start_codon:yes stop_codon:yes gene_type:complete